MNDLTRNFGKMKISYERKTVKGKSRKNERSLSPPIVVQQKKDIMKKLMQYFSVPIRPPNYTQITVQYQILDEHSCEYNDILDKFSSRLIIDRIIKVHNPYLRLAFELRRKEIYDSIEPKMLYHGTKDLHVDAICQQNFDWRLSGLERGHRYGKGVNFSPNSFYAAMFCDKNSDVKVMILAEVMVQNSSVGHSEMVVPPRGYDTTIRENGRVMVKFYDHDFYPAYVIHFYKVR